MVFLTAFSKVLPVFLLILLGVLLRRIRLMRPESVADIKKLVVNVTLPAALFLAFSQVTIELHYLLIVVTVFAACWLVLLLGGRLHGPLRIDSPFMPSLLTGFEAGMMGYAIYGAVYGADNIWRFGIIDLGQVLFVFFVLVPGLKRLSTGATSFRETLLGFLKTPVILAILAGLLASQIGLSDLLAASSIGDSLLETVRLVGSMTTPLVAIAIGYELQLRAGEISRPLRTIATRLLIWVPAGLAFSLLVVGRLLHLDTAFQAAVLTMAILPPPFVIPLFMPNADEADVNFVVNALTLAILVTLVAYPLIPALFPPLTN
ncbi:MAG: AEC family transporter [Anaerolineae bacterium]|nr:AEC family transporter [Anaerolineae bacterium]